MLKLTGLVLFTLAYASASEWTMPQDVPARSKPLAEGLEQIGFVEGAWRIDTFQPTSGEPDGWRPIKSGSASFEPIMGRRYLRGFLQGAPQSYELTLSYDVVMEVWRVTSMDNISGLVDVYEGTVDDSGALSVTNLRVGTHYLQGKLEAHNRITFSPREEGGWSMLVEGTLDLGEHWNAQVRADFSPQ